MSILGYSTAYFLPQYWVNTPLYGEKVIPLLDYILSTDYANAEQLATAFYNIESKYTNSADLPVGVIEEIIDENGYGYIRNLLGDDEDSLKLLVYILVMVHQLKGSKKGIETVLNLLKSSGEPMDVTIVGSPDVTETRDVSGFTVSDFVTISNFNVGQEPFEVAFQITTGSSFPEEQCIASVSNHGFYLGINSAGRLLLSLGQQSSGIRGWQLIDGTTKLVSQKVLLKNTTYYIVLTYSGYDYSVKVSTDGEKYSYYFSIENSTPIDLYGGIMFLGIDNSESVLRYPFNGTISLAPLSVSSNNVKITQWFETSPVGEENTFDVEAEVDVGLISSDFFMNFATFVERYVYPTLSKFRAKLALKNKVTFLPYVRQKVTYIASNMDGSAKEYFNSKVTNTSSHEPFMVKDEFEQDKYDYELVQIP